METLNSDIQGFGIRVGVLNGRKNPKEVKMSFWNNKTLTMTISRSGEFTIVSPDIGSPIKVCGDNFWESVVKLFGMTWIVKDSVERGYSVKVQIKEGIWNKFINHPLR